MNDQDIERIKKKYDLDYHIPFAMTAQEKVDLRGKRILEIGGSLPREFVIGMLGAERWIAIEELGYYDEVHSKIERERIFTMDEVRDVDALGDYAVVSGRAERLADPFFERFDVVFSIAAFEHIDRFPMALSRMHRALKPGGRLFSMYSPIWSAYNGHHLHGVTDKQGRTFSFGNLPIPPWGHLFMRPPQMYRHLLAHTDPDAAAEIVYHVYNSPSINRLFTEDYVDYFVGSAFKVDEIAAIFFAQVPDETQQRLQALYPGYKHFGNNGLMAVLTRPA